MPPPFPDFPVPGVPDQGDCCIWQVHQVARGDRGFQPRRHYPCDQNPTERGDIRGMSLTLTAGDCNERVAVPNGPVLLPDPCTLVTNGPVIRRQDTGLAIYSGEFSLFAGSPPTPRLPPLFTGRMELYDRVGTHVDPVTPPHQAEACNEHIEGWLVGQGENDTLHSYALHLAIAGTMSGGQIVPSGDLTLVLNGVLIRCPRNH